MYSYQDAGSLLRKQSVDRMSGELIRLSNRFQENIERMRLDVQRIASSESVAGYYRADAGDGYDDQRNMTLSLWKQRLIIEFKLLLQQRPDYLQVRYIGVAEEGKELVRLDRKDKAINIMPDENLQAKGSNAYVQDTITLQLGEQYLSRVELNKERGNIVLPPQPVIRVAAPIYTESGSVFGVVVINADFTAIAKPFAAAPPNVSFMLVGENGDYLLHPDKDRQFTLAMGGSAGLVKDFPESLIEIHNQLGIGLLELPEQSAALIHTRHNYDPLNPQSHIMIMAKVSYSVIDELSSGFKQRLIVGVIIIVLLISVGMALLARRLIYPINQLTIAADQVSHGENVKIPAVDRNDELGKLALSFQVMLDHLNTSQTELKLLAGSLEKQVDERTSDLADALKQAEAASIAKGEFLASMSHEIRTPINGVLGMLNLLQNTELNNEQQHQVDVAGSSAKSLLSLINDILDFSKVEADKMELEIIDFNLRKMLGEFVDAIGYLAQQKNLELVIDMSAIEQSMVKGDSGRLRQILNNITSNAIKFTSDGEIVIQARLESIDENTWQFKCDISDTGIGIPENKIDKLFDSFSQVDASTTRKYGGTGLGLAIVKKLSQLMNGDITVTSNPDNGSCFSLCIELGKSSKSQLVVPNADISRLKLLIVDDNTTNREVLGSQLEHWGATVVEADSAARAISILEQCINKDKVLFDIAFLDMQMPEIDGAELGKIIRKNKQFDEIKLIMMTSMGNNGDIEYFSGLGFDGYFPKPTTTDDLFDALSVVADDGEALKLAEPLITSHYLRNLDHPDKIPNPKLWPEGTRLLLVEDNKVNQMVAKGIFNQFGNLVVDVANNGLEALTSLEQASKDNRFSIVIMDCQMPEMDGYETSRQIRAGKAGKMNKSIPIVAMTANAMVGDREKCLEAGMDDYVAKPINKDILLQKLYKYLTPEN